MRARNPIGLEVQGKHVQCIPDFALIAAIESGPNGVPIHEVLTSNLKVSHCAQVIRCAAAQGGVELTWEEAGQEVLDHMESLVPKAAEIIMEAVAPDNSPEPPEGSNAEGRREAREASPGTSSTRSQ